MKNMHFFATAAKGTEGPVRDELRACGFQHVHAERSGVHFEGNIEEGWRACLELRTPMRILLALSEFDAPHEHALYNRVSDVDWLPFFTRDHTLAVRSTCRDSFLTHSQYISQKTKDAIVDRIRTECGWRPSVNTQDPDVAVFINLYKNRAKLYLDLSGESLHRRGYRQTSSFAPLKETLAASVLSLIGWDRKTPLYDPMCGSGTLVIEAGLWSKNFAPGLFRTRFGFERWACHTAEDERQMLQLREHVQAKSHSQQCSIFGSDNNRDAIHLARTCAQKANVNIQFQVSAIDAFQPITDSGCIITNPPYGERLTITEDLYPSMRKAFERLHHFQIAVLSADPHFSKQIGLPIQQTWTLYNGAIETKLYALKQ